MDARLVDLDLSLDRRSPVPLYHQLANQLERAIAEGRLAKGSYLQNEIELAERLNISRPTVRQALQDLADRGLLVRRRGVGTQVVNHEVRRPITLSSLFDDLAAAGRSPSTRVITLGRVAANEEIAADLDVAPGSEVVHIERCRIADGRRLAVLRNWLRLEFASHLTPEQLATDGLYQLLRAAGVRPHSAAQQIGAAAASLTDATLLNLAVGAPLLTMRRLMRDDTGTPVEVGQHVYDASVYTVEMNVLDS